MKLTIEIDCDSFETPEKELTRILLELATRILNRSFFSEVLYDSNRNRVGTANFINVVSSGDSYE